MFFFVVVREKKKNKYLRYTGKTQIKLEETSAISSKADICFFFFFFDVFCFVFFIIRYLQNNSLVETNISLDVFKDLKNLKKL